MNRNLGLRRQIMFSLGIMALSIILLSVLGSYGFYAVVMAYSPDSVSETWLPSRVELLWIAATVLAALAMAIGVAIRLSRRIVAPMNAVAHSLRALAQGNLQARVATDQLAPGETAQLVHDFNTMAERLQSLAQEQAFWNAAVAHELRTPVTILRGRLQGLTEGVFTPSADVLLILLRQVENLNRLIEDLRVISLTDSGHLELRLECADLAHEISTVMQTFQANLKAKGFTPHLELALQQRIMCDPERIRQALMALIENALKYADPGILTVHLWRDEANCHLSVADQGPGIPAEFTTQVFEAFRREDPSRSRKSGGSGLGLAVVKAIAQAHGGHVSCHSDKEKGTTFTFSWPLTLPVRAEQAHHGADE
ncbi:ATP-binding protein [Alcaligenes aquatilis]|uniref:ATP-binding protein n=1 Tax=Alcaligenes aquatilis TaxID=323284 RepID=UPI003F91826E